ncbi:MAG: cation:proton antiporter, partial [Clostridium sp.]
MNILIIIISLIIIGVFANYSGKIIEKLKLPALVGMMILGMFIGPSFLNIVPKETLALSSEIK